LRLAPARRIVPVVASLHLARHKVYRWLKVRLFRVNHDSDLVRYSSMSELIGTPHDRTQPIALGCAQGHSRSRHKQLYEFLWRCMPLHHGSSDSAFFTTCHAK
jgi:hypothetical protein